MYILDSFIALNSLFMSNKKICNMIYGAYKGRDGGGLGDAVTGVGGN